MTTKKFSITEKTEEQPWLRDEILNRLGLGKDFFSMIFVVTGILLPLALQYTGLIALLVPPIGLALAFKLGGNDLRIGQINYFLRRGLRSTWEIFRRYVFDGKKITPREQVILQEQELLLSEREITAIRKQLSPRFPSLSAWGDRWGFLVFYCVSIGIGGTKTYPDALRGNITTLFLWAAACIATLLTIAVLGRRRVRDLSEEVESEEFRSLVERLTEMGYAIEHSKSYIIIEDAQGLTRTFKDPTQVQQFITELTGKA